MKILIVGNLGYIGPTLVRQLRKTYPQGTLIGFDIGYFAHCLTNASESPELALDTQVFGDIRQFPESLLSGVDAVVNLVGERSRDDSRRRRFFRQALRRMRRASFDFGELGFLKGVPDHGARGRERRQRSRRVAPRRAKGYQRIRGVQRIRRDVRP